MTPVQYSPSERFWLTALAVFGFVVVNGAFLFGVLGKWGVSRLSWTWFLFLSLVGSMAFALPVVLLWRERRAPPPTS